MNKVNCTEPREGNPVIESSKENQNDSKTAEIKNKTKLSMHIIQKNLRKSTVSFLC